MSHKASERPGECSKKELDIRLLRISFVLLALAIVPMPGGAQGQQDPSPTP